MTHELELLDIQQAAALLHVSETSLRRWTNAGRLACLRVDGLHARSTCFLAAAPEVRDRVRTLLERQRPSLRDDIAAGRLVFSDYADSAAAQLESWETRFVAATRAGARSLRVVGDVSGGQLGQGSAFDEVLEYEA